MHDSELDRKHLEALIRFAEVTMCDGAEDDPSAGANESIGWIGGEEMETTYRDIRDAGAAIAYFNNDLPPDVSEPTVLNEVY